MVRTIISMNEKINGINNKLTNSENISSIQQRVHHDDITVHAEPVRIVSPPNEQDVIMSQELSAEIIRLQTQLDRINSKNVSKSIVSETSKDKHQSVDSNASCIIRSPAVVVETHPVEVVTVDRNDLVIDLLTNLTKQVVNLSTPKAVGNVSDISDVVDSTVMPAIVPVLVQKEPIVKVVDSIPIQFDPVVNRPVENVYQQNVRKSRNEWLNIDKFDGQSSSWSAFLARFHICANYNGWNDDDKVAHLLTALRGNADHVLWTDPSKIWQLDELIMVLNKRFGNGGQTALYRAELSTRRQKPDESIYSLQQDLIRLMALAYEGPNTPHTNAFAVEAFLKALTNRDIADKVRELDPSDLDEAARHARRFDSYVRCNQKSVENVDGNYKNRRDYNQVRATGGDNKTFSQNKPKNNFSQNNSKTNRTEEEFQRILLENENLKRSLENYSSPPPVQVFRNDSPPFVGTPPPTFVDDQARAPSRNYDNNYSGQSYNPSLNSDRTFHQNGQSSNNYQQPPLRKVGGGDQSRQYYNNSRGPIICWACKEPNHFSRNCPNTKTTDQANYRAGRNKRGQGAKIPNFHPLNSGRVFLSLKLLGKERFCLLDSGCERSLIPSWLSAGLNVRPTFKSMQASNETDLEVIGEVQVPFLLEDFDVSVEALIAPQIQEIILGMDWLAKYDISWYCGRGAITFNNQIFELVDEYEIAKIERRNRNRDDFWPKNRRPSLQVGDVVRYYSRTRDGANVIFGPYLVVRILDRRRVMVQFSSSSKPWPAPIFKLEKLYHKEPVPVEPLITNNPGKPLVDEEGEDNSSRSSYHDADGNSLPPLINVVDIEERPSSAESRECRNASLKTRSEHQETAEFDSFLDTLEFKPESIYNDVVTALAWKNARGEW